MAFIDHGLQKALTELANEAAASLRHERQTVGLDLYVGRRWLAAIDGALASAGDDEPDPHAKGGSGYRPDWWWELKEGARDELADRMADLEPPAPAAAPATIASATEALRSSLGAAAPARPDEESIREQLRRHSWIGVAADDGEPHDPDLDFCNRCQLSRPTLRQADRLELCSGIPGELVPVHQVPAQ